MNELFSITNIAVNIPLPGFGGADTYAMSWVELWSTLLALTAVIGARLNKVWWYPFGILNSIGFIAIFYQTQLYSDLLLNVYFIGISILGWRLWTRKKGDGSEEYPIRSLSNRSRLSIFLWITGLSLTLGAFINPIFSSIASIFVENYAHMDASMPYLDATATIMSIFAMTLLTKRYIESWLLWVLVDVVCIIKYLETGVVALAVIYSIFLLNAIYALYQWNKLKEDVHAT